ncbi:MAG: AraC family transcriptional regulator [Hyphomicrobiales bacterium]|nr:AraC family transcriptional regulator [Hyphomicrobiales bacterium]
MSEPKFIVDLGWQVLLKDLEVSADDLLRQADLPRDLLSRSSPALTTSEYFRLWDGLARLLEAPAFPLRLGQAVSVEAFSPPIFACFCSADLNAALVRLSQYKPLIGPLRLDVAIGDQATRVVLAGLPAEAQPPAAMMATELVFLVHLARLATRERIVPLSVHFAGDLPEANAYKAFFGVPVISDSYHGLSFSAEDARRPFMTASETMWSVFEAELRARMSDLGPEAGFRDRVRACLTEVLASGQCTMPSVARRLAVSTRTLQRRLRDEDTSFQRELNSLREELARHYLTNSHYSGAEISFLLGYNDPNSFIRAFHAWTGLTPEAARPERRLQ